MREHDFTPVIRRILIEQFSDYGETIFQQSELLQYINLKTASATRGSKARGSFGNLYAIYVLVEDYVKRGFHENSNYREADGARFTNLLRRQRELPFGSKMQNHALNHRMNKEFERYFPTSGYIPIIRDVQTNQYWINENLLLLDINDSEFNIAEAVMAIIEAYIEAKQGAFNSFIADCERMQTISHQNPNEVQAYLYSLLRPNVDARIFEIASFAILKVYYRDKSIYWGWTPDDLDEERLYLYKTVRTNANDGGIDFVMRPLGRFFQVTETLEVKKYFLDIDKIQKYPVTFVIKSELDLEVIRTKLREQAEAQYPVKRIVERYLDSIEEIINIPVLLDRLSDVIQQDGLAEVMDEIVTHSKIEFNLQE
jgi:hypothetical protein